MKNIKKFFTGLIASLLLVGFAVWSSLIVGSVEYGTPLYGFATLGAWALAILSALVATWG